MIRLVSSVNNFRYLPTKIRAVVVFFVFLCNCSNFSITFIALERKPVNIPMAFKTSNTSIGISLLARLKEPYCFLVGAAASPEVKVREANRIRIVVLLYLSVQAYFTVNAQCCPVRSTLTHDALLDRIVFDSGWEFLRTGYNLFSLDNEHHYFPGLLRLLVFWMMR